MIASVPSVFIYSDEGDAAYLEEVLSGIEEEGVPYQVFPRSGPLYTLAYQAAEESVLGSGIAICGQELAMHLRPLPCGRPVFHLDHPRLWQCRRLGANSARAVKKQPFLDLWEEGD